MNNGDAPLYVYGVSVSGQNPSSFSVSSADAQFSVEPGLARSILVQFRPTGEGTHSAAVVIKSNAVNNPDLSVQLSGYSPVFYAKPQANFSASPKKGALPLTVFFSNTNKGGKVDRWEWQLGERLPPVYGIAMVITRSNGDTLTYTYTQPGVYKPMLEVDGPGGGDAQYLADSIVVELPPAVIPAVLYPGAKINPASLVMDSTNIGAMSQKTFTVNNDSAAALSISSIAMGGANASEFSVSPDSVTIESGDSRIFVVSFRPKSDGAKTANVTISHNAVGGQSVVALNGKGTVKIADFNKDGVVDLADFNIFADHFGEAITPANQVYDLNADSKINLADFFIMSDL